MANRSSTLIPAHPEDLYCQTCPERFGFQGSISQTIDLARTRGWGVLDEGGTVVKSICPGCKGTPRSREKPPPVLKGQIDVFFELGVTPTLRDIEPRRKRKDPS